MLDKLDKLDKLFNLCLVLMIISGAILMYGGAIESKLILLVGFAVLVLTIVAECMLILLKIHEKLTK